MGCDLFYSGVLPDYTLQEKVISFVQSRYESVDVIIEPHPEFQFVTMIGEMCEEKVEPAYPFDFYGIIPSYSQEEIFPHGQFIFDRQAGGRLIYFKRLPGVPDLSGRFLADKSKNHFPEGIQCHVVYGGYDRGSGSYIEGLLYEVLRLRWWPELSVDDDYGVCCETRALIHEYGIGEALLDETLDFIGCRDLFVAEYEKRNPRVPAPDIVPPITEGVHAVDLDVLNSKIEDCDFSARVIKCMEAVHIKTIRDLVTSDPAALLSLPNFGKRCVIDVRETLQYMGIVPPF